MVVGNPGRPMTSSFEPVVAVAAVMAEFPNPWFVSGGWAIDLFVGRVTREHHDVEVGLFLPDQEAVRAHLRGWDLFRIREDAWEPWADGDVVALPEFQLQARAPEPGGRAFDLFLNPREGDEWVSRRHAGLRVPAAAIVEWSAGHGADPAGIPFLAPEIQLLYKAKYHRPKDDADFAVALPRLDGRRRAWLRAALEVHHPADP